MVNRIPIELRRESVVATVCLAVVLPTVHLSASHFFDVGPGGLTGSHYMQLLTRTPSVGRWTDSARRNGSTKGRLTSSRQAPVWKLERQLIVTETDSAPLTAVRQVIAMPNGAVMVVDSRDEGVLVFDEEGNYRRRIGRRGEGPGEFAGVTLAGYAADTVWVTDGELRRVSFFNNDGTHVGPSASIMPDGLVPIAYQAIGLLPGRTIVAVTADSEPIEDLRIIAVRDGMIIDTVGQIRFGQSSLLVPLPSISGRIVANNPFNSGEYVAVAPNSIGLVAVEQPIVDTLQQPFYKVTLRKWDRTLDWTIRVPYDAEPLPQAEVDAWIKTIIAGLVEDGVMSSSALEAAVRGVLKIPSHRPPIMRTGWGAQSNSFLFDDRGQVWVQRSNGTWDIVGRNGRVAIVKPDAGVRLHAVSNGYVWGVERGEDGVPKIIQYRIIRS